MYCTHNKLTNFFSIGHINRYMRDTNIYFIFESKPDKEFLNWGLCVQLHYDGLHIGISFYWIVIGLQILKKL